MTLADVERMLAKATEHDDTGVMIACYVVLGREHPRELELREPEACAYYASMGARWCRDELQRDYASLGSPGART